MSTIREDPIRVSTILTYNRVKEIPGLGLDPLHRTHSAGSASVASTSVSCTPSEKEGRENIPLDEPCFITKRPGYSLHRAHWINAVRKDQSAKKAMEIFLSHLGIVPEDFNLNSASNITPLDQTLHYTLDKLGFYAITCSEPTLRAMLDTVKEKNRIYASGRVHKTRIFDLNQPPFSNAEYDMVVMHPSHLLPIGSTIAMHTQDPSEQSRMLVGKLYMVGKDGALREGRSDDSLRFPPFKSNDNRDPKHRLNPFLVVLNADMAFRRFTGLSSLCSEYQTLVNLTKALAKEIYHPQSSHIALFIAKQFRFRPAELLQPRDGDTEMEDADDFGTNTAHDQEATITPKRRKGTGNQRLAAINSRLGREVSEPTPDASEEERQDYYRYLLSGRDAPLTRRDEAVLRSIGLHPCGDEDEDSDGSVSDDEEDE